jgi:FAD binding domain/Aromatic-ring hydroxylase, C-terminal
MFNEVVGKRVPHELISIRRWIARNVVSDAYRNGRVFFAGDAAHLNHPSSGLGLNTGLGDAVDLGWKLAATLAGWGGAGLLTSYEVERQPVGRRNISHADVSHQGDRERAPPPEIFADTPAGERARRTMGDAIVASMTRKFITDGLALGYRYDPSPICCNEAGAAPHTSIEDYHPNAVTGSRAPHAWLPDGRSIIDLYGRGFTLVRFGDNAPDVSAIERAFASRGVPLSVESVADPAIAALYVRRLVLVRPDGHVAWRADAPLGDPTALVDRVRGASAH